ncbi:winged helix DNA-binding domain-containing protein [Pseudonocardia humida]|uniref:AlkZ family DNA glycosylase n=1 Tax=Pseudonocardia humida TaxID=2800819 RepID=A0ABT0ZZP3_9PSEU|nr:winged helix DNA-binding domain-containing protein [Pseudonocardia humida]MCO1656220.1 AlkZ family DNA glycosylase [Pseudonocardia humida]
MTVIGTRELNRALLARQLLLDRHDMSAVDAVRHLVGVQAQEPLEPYAGLWSRLRGFVPAELVELLEGRRAVRTLLMRRTLHLVTAEDAVGLRALHQPMLEQRVMAVLRARLPGVDLAELRAAGTPLFAERPRTLTDVARAVAGRWPGVAPRDLGDALSSVVPLVQVPPRGVWGASGPAANTTIEAWLGRPVAAAGNPGAGRAEDLVLRYLAAFGPAASADVRAWSGLTGLPAAIARLRPELEVLRDGRGRELLDLPGAPRPDPDVPAPPRFLPAFDNAVLGYDDRTRVIDDRHRGLSVGGARFLLVDGRVAATWTTEPAQPTRAADDPPVLRISALVPITGADRDAVVEEGAGLLAFLTDGRTDGRVEIDGPAG